MAMAPTELLKAAQDGQLRLHAIVTRRIKFERNRILADRPVQDFIRKETLELSKIHDAFDDGLLKLQNLLNEPPILIHESNFFNLLDKLDRCGQLPLPTNTIADLISRVRNPPDLEKARQLQRLWFKSREESNVQI